MTATTIDHSGPGTRTTSVGVVAPPAETDQGRSVAHTRPVGSAPSSPDTDRCSGETQCSSVGSGDPSCQQPTECVANPMEQASAAGNSEDVRPPASDAAPSVLRPPGPDVFLELRRLSECFLDIQEVRMRTENRLRSGQVSKVTTDALLKSVRNSETMLRSPLKKALKVAHPELYAWAGETPGIGEHTLGLLLGHTGHPIIAHPHHWTDHPPEDHVCDPDRCGKSRHLVAGQPFVRSQSQFRSYCGHGDPARKRRKGMTADDAMALGNPGAKRATYLMAKACMQQTGAGNGERSPYRDVYEDRRITTAGTRPEWTDGHALADALRITGKEILNDVWAVAREAMPDD